MASTEIRVPVVDDEPIIIADLQLGLEEAGYAVISAPTADDAMAFVESKAHELRALVTDINLRGKVTG